MKYAVMIIAHKNKEQLIRLIKALDDKDIDVYVHLDKKWKISENDISDIKHAARRVTVLKKRISGFLDTWSLCQIAVELSKEAIGGGQYSYFILLSGQDYPIKSIDYIKRYLNSVYPKPIIDCTPISKTNWIYSGFRWIRFHACYRFIDRITESRRLRKILRLPVYAVQAVVTFIMRSPYKRLTKIGCELYGGSAWWILPRQIIEMCIQEVEQNTKTVRAFKLKNTPEETFFQTMAMRSPLRNMIEVNDKDAVLQNCMTYAYFFDDQHAPTGHPYTLTANNLDMLLNRKELFARKFDICEDSKILDMLDDHIKEGK